VRFDIEIDDIEAWTADRSHRGKLSGDMRLGSDEMRVAGEIHIMTRAKRGGGHYIRYLFETANPTEPYYRFVGAKEVKDDPGLDLIEDATFLKGNFVARDADTSGEKEARKPSVQIRFDARDPANLARFLSSITVTRPREPWDEVAVRTRFFGVWFGGIADEFFVGKAEKLRRTTLVPHDYGQDKTPYCCTFHYIPLPDGKVAVLDLIRFEPATARAGVAILGERTFLWDPRERSLRGLILEAPEVAANGRRNWQRFHTDTEGKPDLGGRLPVMGRGARRPDGKLAAATWLRGRVAKNAAGGIGRARWDLEVSTLGRDGKDLGGSIDRLLESVGSDLTHMNADDHTKVHYRGWLSIDGKKYAVDGLGIASEHYGDGTGLPSYLYGSPLPAELPKAIEDDHLLIVSTVADNYPSAAVRQVIKANPLTYYHGRGGVPRQGLHHGEAFRANSEHLVVPLGKGVDLELSFVAALRHRLALIGKERDMAFVVADATLVHRQGAPGFSTLRRPLGEMLLDIRGELLRRVEKLLPLPRSARGRRRKG
jgi:hypothetical protein